MTRPAKPSGAPPAAAPMQQPPAELRHAHELALLAASDRDARPPGWLLSPVAVLRFIMGSSGDAVEAPASAQLPEGCPRRLAISAKFIGARALVERAVVTLAGERGLMLVGEPGTAKSMLSELLAAAVCGTGALTVQGTAGTAEEHLRYGWNYALLLAKGPVPEALVDSPVLAAMRSGRIVRVEEVTRCLPEVQDALVSILSERRIAIPELGAGATVFARPGFNLIATANLRDRGVSEMSAALKRRFNFEVVPPIADAAQEIALVRAQATGLLARDGAAMPLDEAVVEALVTAFRDLRQGRSAEGWAVEKPATAMSTAECVAVAAAVARQSAYFVTQGDPLSLIPGHLLGAVLKDEAEDRARLLAYWDAAVKRRAEAGGRIWARLYELRGVIESG